MAAGTQKREADTQPDEAPSPKQTKLEAHGVKADSPEVEAIDAPSKADAKPKKDTKEEADTEQEINEEAETVEETAAEDLSKPDSDTKPEPASEEVKAAEEDLEKQGEVLEHGHIYFFYKPKVEVENPSSIDDVARLHILLKPSSGQSRLIIVGRKYLPDPESHRQPIWAFVKQLADDAGDLSSYLEKSSYETKTRGTRHVGEDRLIGVGPYCLVYHEGEKVSDRSSYLAYVLEAPAEIGEVQTEFNLAHEGSFGLSVRNPKTPAPRQAGLSTPADFPDDLIDAFEGRRWNPILDLRYLNTENSELLLVTHKKEIQGGEEIKEDLETLAAEDAEHFNQNPTKTVAQHLYAELHFMKGKIDVKTITGNWD